MSISKKFSGSCRCAVQACVAVLGIAGVSGAAHAQSDQQFRNLFFKNGYGYCDARKLGKIWSMTPGRAKAVAGRKISWGNIGIVRQDWARGVAFFQKYGFRCGQASLKDEREKFAYHDADRVARAWRSRPRG